MTNSIAVSPVPIVVLAVVAVVLLTLANAFFTLAETALIAVRNARLQHLVNEEGQGPHVVARVKALVHQPTRVFATVQVGITLASFAASSIVVVVLAPEVGHWMLAHGLYFHPLRIALILMTLAAALFTLVAAELVPRAVAQGNPERVAMFVSFPLPAIMTVLSVLATVALWLSNMIVRPLGLKATFSAPILTEDELRLMLDAGAQSGAIEEEEKEIIRNVISFGDTDVRQVMTPRIDIRGFDIAEDTDTLIALIIESGHSRIPLYEGSIDTVVGIVHAKDLLPDLAVGTAPASLGSLARPPLFVPENRRVDGLLEIFKRTNQHLAIVQDEYGGTAGLVTLEDLLEELVGEIGDEYDTDEDIAKQIDERDHLIDARMRIDEVNEAFGAHFSTEDFETIGGYVFGLFGRLPVAGESIEDEHFHFLITDSDQRAIRQIQIDPRSAGTTEATS